MRFFLLVFTLCFAISCTKLPKGAVTFHNQSSKGESKNMLFTYNRKTKQELVFRKNPDFFTSNFDSFRPFPASDGKTYGAIFLLDRVSKSRLSHFTTQNQGNYLLSVVNGKPSEPVVIDKTINDGALVVWSGMTVRDIRSLEIEMPRTGQDLDEWKKNAKKSKEALRNLIKAEKQKRG